MHSFESSPPGLYSTVSYQGAPRYSSAARSCWPTRVPQSNLACIGVRVKTRTWRCAAIFNRAPTLAKSGRLAKSATSTLPTLYTYASSASARGPPRSSLW